MMKFTPILINIEGLNDAAAQKITNTFVDSLGKVRHSDGMAFYRDFQPVCREQDCRATLVDGVRAEVMDGGDDSQCEINLVSVSGEEKEFNAILVLRKTNNIYSIAQLYLFVPSEKVNSLHGHHITVSMTLDDESEKETEKDYKNCDYNCNSCTREDCKWSKANKFGKPADIVDEFSSTIDIFADEDSEIEEELKEYDQSTADAKSDD
jgi:hypothetical protein